VDCQRGFLRIDVMLLGAHAQRAHQAHCRQENSSPHRSPLKSELPFRYISGGSGPVIDPDSSGAHKIALEGSQGGTS